MSDHNTRFTPTRTKPNHCGFAALVDTARDPLVLIDKNYQIIAANAAYTDIHGISSEQVILTKPDPSQRKSDKHALFSVLIILWELWNLV